MEPEKRSKSETFFSIIKNLFFLALFLSIVPTVISSFKTTLLDTLSPKAHVGYLTIHGPITDAAFYVKKLDDLSKDTEIKALLLRINSPGGYSGSCQAIFNELKKFKKKKPVVALIENTGASGAYHIAAASNTIISSPMALVGSIGVFMELPNVKDLLNSWKVQYRYVQAGSYKTVGSMTKDLSAEELAYLQRLTDDSYAQFTKDIAECRNLSVKDHKRWADGQAFSGNQAFKLHLVDKLGSYNDAITEIKRLAKIAESDEIKLVSAKRPMGLLMRLLSGDDDEFGQEQTSMTDSVAFFLSNVYTKFSVEQSQHTVHTM